jgi:hypothetical protein
LLWRGVIPVGYQVGSRILKAPEDELPISLEYTHVYQGEVDITATTETVEGINVDELNRFISPLLLGYLTFLNLCYGEFLVPTAPTTTRRFIVKGKVELSSEFFTDFSNL